MPKRPSKRFKKGKEKPLEKKIPQRRVTGQRHPISKSKSLKEIIRNKSN
ncbi:MAG: hypothetical protein ABSC11_11905 [Smithella sp.]|jgi:hypothetical protein